MLNMEGLCSFFLNEHSEKQRKQYLLVRWDSFEFYKQAVAKDTQWTF